MKLIKPSYEIRTRINGEQILADEVMRPLLDEFKQRIPILFDDITYE
jgi:hypothetical protein